MCRTGKILCVCLLAVLAAALALACLTKPRGPKYIELFHDGIEGI